LARTLKFLGEQELESKIPWEVVVIDNASSDDTPRVAIRSWHSVQGIPLKVVYESRMGLSYARDRGFIEAKYPIVSFVDDDNWVSPDWVQLVSEIMSQHLEIGACGGSSEPACEIAAPTWFETYKENYAVGPQGETAGDVTESRGFLWGAGLTIRASAWQQLSNKQFAFLLTDRCGKSVGAGSDSELCYALRLAGWRLWYEPRLRLQHFIPAERLQWRYLRRLCRGFGASGVGLAPYVYLLGQETEKPKIGIKQIWYWQVAATVIILSISSLKLAVMLFKDLEGDSTALYLESRIGRLLELLQRRQKFDLSFSQVYRFRRSTASI
jgi:glycosyltransferase involved in cell wall biosynthesis